MSFQEWAVAVGLLTPLVLGILAFIEKFLHQKREREREEQGPLVVQGMTVEPDSYVDQLISELRRELKETKRELEIERAINERKNNVGR